MNVIYISDKQHAEYVRQICESAGATFSWEDNFDDNNIETESVSVYTRFIDTAQNIAYRLITSGIPFAFSIQED